MPKKPIGVLLSEDVWAVIVAFVLILLAVLGVLGEGGLPVSF
ncbi:MAG: hypothetical protein ABWK53_06850 [Anaerolineales bacterium]